MSANAMPRTERSNDFLKVELTGYLWMHYRRFSLFDKDELHMPVFKSYMPVKNFDVVSLHIHYDL